MSGHRSGPPTSKPEHPHGGPPGQTGQNPGQGDAAPPGQSKPDAEPRAVPPTDYDALSREQAHATQQAPVTPNEPPDDAAKG